MTGIVHISVLRRLIADLPNKCQTLKTSTAIPVTQFHTTLTRDKKRGHRKNRGSISVRPLDENKPPETSMSKLFKPVVVLPNPDDINLGKELAGNNLDRSQLLSTLNSFFQSSITKTLSREQGLDDYLYWQACISFRKYCMDIQYLPPELYILFSDILQGAVHEDSIFPYFLKHAKRVFPHLECLEELKLISDLTDPPNWYPEARSINRKIIFHSGPTNSGKTYHALERFMSAESGVYCGPLKLLAVEVFQKANSRGTICDLITGEERRYMSPDGEPANHISCTVEMTNVNQTYEVAVIDEIQMVKDYQRGWAWTRALLGIPAEEIHVCGEAAAIDLIKEIAIFTGEEVEVRSYKRLTPLVQDDKALETLHNVEPGDCIVCFNKQDIYAVSRGLERLGKEAAVIYGSLPPNTKLAMANRFNDPDDPCKYLVATDAIGMGLNLNIRRIIFYSLSKLTLLENGDKEMRTISVSQSLQIAGRAGRYNTKWETGHVTTFNQEDIPLMKNLLAQSPEEILRAGLHPTFDQIELYAYHLPQATLANLIDIFTSLSVLDDSLYSLCHMDDFKFLADMVEHIKLPLKAKYTFCCAPINRKMPFVCTMFLKIVRQYSRGELITFDWLCHRLGWPFAVPDTIIDLMQLEAVHDVLDLYLWLSYRFPDMFPDVELVRSIQAELDEVIKEGVSNIVQLLRNADAGTTSSATRVKDEDAFEAKHLSRNKLKKWKHSDQGNPSDLDDDTQPIEGKLATQLIESGLLTKKMFIHLQREWKFNEENKGKTGKSRKIPVYDSQLELSKQLVKKGHLKKHIIDDLKAEWEKEKH